MRGVRTPRKGAVIKDATGKDAMGKTHEERCDDKATADDSHVSADSPSQASPITSSINGLCHAHSTSSLTRS